VDITSDGGNVTLVLPRSDNRYALSTTSDGGNVGVQLGIVNSLSNDRITIGSGGGDIQVAYPRS
jgi:large exoprotein involved in heme utilization and adhesion